MSSIKAVQAARRLALQALYQHEISGTDVSDLLLQYRADPVAKKADLVYFEALLNGCMTGREALQATLQPLLDRDWTQIDPIERSVFYIAAWELEQRLEIPWKVVINEAIEQARSFGGDDSWRYVNAVLDRLAAQTESRSLERSGG